MVSFTHDSSLNYLQIEEPNLHEAYRSTATVTPPTGDCAGIACEAYLCTTKEDRQLRVYAALLEIRSKEILVYPCSPQPATAAEYAKTLKEGIAFLKSLGFSLEPINLNFSTAMRQVIIRDIRVLRPPDPQRTPSRSRSQQTPPASPAEPAALPDKPAPPPPPEKPQVAAHPTDKKHAPKGEESKTAAAGPGPADAGIEKLQAQLRAHEQALGAAKQKLERLSAAHKSAEDAAAQQIAALREELARTTAEKLAAVKALEDLLPNATAPGEPVPDPEALRALRDELTTLQSEQARLMAEGEEARAALTREVEETRAALALVKQGTVAAEEAAERLREELQAAAAEASRAQAAVAEEIAGLRSARDAVALELATAREAGANDAREAATLREELAQLQAAQDAASEAFAGELVRTREESERLRSEATATQTKAAAELDALNAELERLRAEQTAAGAKATGELTALREELARAKAGQTSAEEELATVQAKLERRSRDAATQERLAGEELARVRAELERTRSAQHAVGTATSDEQAGLRTELANVQAKRAAAEQEVAVMRSALEQLCSEKAATERMAAEELIGVRKELERVGAQKAMLEKKLEAQLAGTGPAAAAPAAADLEALRSRLQQVTLEKETLVGALTSQLTLMRQEIDQLRQQPKTAATDRQEPPPANRREPAAEEQGSIWDRSRLFATMDAAMETDAPLDPASAPPRLSFDSVAGFPDDKAFTGFGGDEPGQGRGTGDTAFVWAPALAAIPFAALEQIVEVRQSMNQVEAIQGGNPIQKCAAYICAVKSDKVPEIFLAWLLTESKKVMVYLPERQPVDPIDYGRVLTDAVYYFETAGFMMDTVSLPTSDAKRDALLTKIPVLRQEELAARAS